VVKVVRDKTFLYREGMWIDTTFDADRMTPLKVGFMSDDYFALVGARPEWGAYLSVGDRVLVVLDGQAYQVVAPEQGESIAVPTPAPTEPASTKPVSATPVARTTPTAPDPLATATPADRQTVVCGASVGSVLLSLVAAVLFSRRR
jgi:hypothetical protein